MVMLGNHSSPPVHFWAGRYPSKIGWLVGPSGMTKTRLRSWLPYALDNDAFSAWQHGDEWSEANYYSFLEWVANQDYSPLWAAVPDVVADPDATHARWEQYAPTVKEYGWPLAFVVQDGMTPSDVPDDAEVVFVGGTYKWKWRSVEAFTEQFDRVHIGRVNTIQKLRRSEELGAESVDGTGWFRRPEREFYELEEFLSGVPDRQIALL